MKASIAVKTKEEKHAIEVALADPEVRAFVLCMGYLLPLPSDRARRRVLTFITDACYEDAARSLSVESAPV